jgi:hypothetical protein
MPPWQSWLGRSWRWFPIRRRRPGTQETGRACLLRRRHLGDGPWLRDLSFDELDDTQMRSYSSGSTSGTLSSMARKLSRLPRGTPAPGSAQEHFVEDPIWRFLSNAGLNWLHHLRSAAAAVLSYWWLKGAWPSVEFDFGSDHLRTARIRRNRLAVLATLVIVPMATSFIYDQIVK